MSHISLNEDGTLPMDIDQETGRRTPTAEVEAHFSSIGGEHPDLAAHEALGLAEAAHTHPGGDHPSLATHTGMGLAATSHDHPHAHSYASNTHTHAQADVSSLTVDLAAKAASGHNHDAAYSATGHTHSYAATSHSHLDADIPAAIARDAEVTSAIATHAATPHGGSTEAFPVGAVFISVVATNPATLLGYGTWAAFGAGRVLIGNDGATYGTDEATGGAATAAISAHTGAAVADHGALTHSGATVGNHTFTQPGAHSNHVVTQPNAHTDVLNHVHTQNINTATTGGVVGFPALKDTSTSGSEATGLVTSNPTANGVASQAHTGAAVDAHSAHSGGAVDAHTVGQASQHAAQSHSVTQPGAHTDISTLQPYIVVHMFKRTA